MLTGKLVQAFYREGDKAITWQGVILTEPVFDGDPGTPAFLVVVEENESHRLYTVNVERLTFIKEAATTTSVRESIHEALNVLYLNDSSNYSSSLWTIIKLLDPEIYKYACDNSMLATKRT